MVNTRTQCVCVCVCKATNACGLKLLVYETLGLKLLVYEALSSIFASYG